MTAAAPRPGTAPDSRAAALLNAAVACLDAGDRAGARAGFAALLAQDPGAQDLGAQDPEARDSVFAEAHWALACLDLMAGNWADAWPHYPWRERLGRVPARPTPFPRWTGQPLAGRRILVWGDEGVGEELRHAALVHDLLARGAAVVLECDPRLVGLFRRSFAAAPAVAVAARAWPPDPATVAADIAFAAPLSALLPHLHPSPPVISPDDPRRGGWLRADPAATADLARACRGGGAARLVGIAWRTRATVPGGAAKSLALARLAAAVTAAWPATRLVVLQYGPVDDDLAALPAALRSRVTVAPGVDPLADLDRFAALVAAMDAVVSTGNTAVHMAGALGRLVWALVHRGAPMLPWWIDDGLRPPWSPWYPDARIVPQLRPGDWDGALAAFARRARAEEGR